METSQAGTGWPSREIELAKSLYDIDEQISATNQKLKELRESKKEAEQELIEYLSENGKNSTGHISGVGTFTIRRETYPSVTKAELPRFIEHLRERGEDGIVEETIPSPTLKSYLKGKISELAEEFVESPEYQEKVEKELGLEHGSCAPAELAGKVYETVGVRTFQDMKIAVTKKGKE